MTNEIREQSGDQLTISERVHIMPIAHEVDRLVEPAERYRADVVEIIHHHEMDDEASECLEMVESELENRSIDYRKSVCGLYNVNSALGCISELIGQHKGDDVYVNASSGNKITAIAGAVASMVSDATAYYAKAEQYSRPPTGIEAVSELPSYPIDAPEPQQVTIMALIYHWSQTRGPPTKGEVIEVSQEINLPYTRRDITGKGLYRLLDSQILDPLEDREWIEVGKSGRNRVVRLTEQGVSALTAFRGISGSEQDWRKFIEENDL